jgi:hypothetical protein
MLVRMLKAPGVFLRAWPAVPWAILVTGTTVKWKYYGK